MREGWIHAVALALWAGAMHFWLRDGYLVPLGYDGDGFHYVTFFRNLLDGGWALHNARLGAPFGAWAWDFPNADVAFHVLAWLITRFTSEVGLAFNLFYALGFPAAYAAAYWVLRRMGVGVALAAGGAFAFAFLPYHFWRMLHLWLATYFIVPLVVWVCVRLWGEAWGPLWQWARTRKGSIAIAIVSGTMGAYYAFFAAMLFAATGAVTAARARSLRPLAAALLLSTATGVVVLAQLVPSIGYHAKFGENLAISGPRSAVQSQVYGLNLAFALTPHESHRIPAARELARAVRESTLHVNENAFTYLGLMSVAGTLALLLHALGGSVRAGRSEVVPALACVSLVSILYATIAGFGYLFALLVTPEIRALNRISVFLGFTGIAALVVLVQAWLDRRAQGRMPAAALALAMMGLALVDQVPVIFPNDRAAHVKRYAGDREFVARIEASVPPGTRVLTLPYVDFPENSYELLRPYAHSTTTRWSFGAMRNRSYALWIQALSTLAPDEMVRLASASGFGGIYLDGRLYPDGGAAKREAIAAQVGKPWMAGPGEGQYFIALEPTGDVPVDLGTPPSLGGGFYGWEGAGNNRFSWCRGKGVLQFLNAESRARTADIAFELHALSPRTVQVSWNGGPPVAYAVDAASKPFTLRGLVMEPGENALHFHSEAPARPPGTSDPRPLSFAVRNPRVL